MKHGGVQVKYKSQNLTSLDQLEQIKYVRFLDVTDNKIQNLDSLKQH